MSNSAVAMEPRPLRRVTTWVAIAMFAIAIMMVLLLQWVLSLPHPTKLDIETSGNSPFAFLASLAFSIVGALIVSRRPSHPIGWIYCASGMLVGVTAFTTGYTQYNQMVPGVLPAGGLASAVSDISFSFGFMLPITFGLLLFPDGHLPSRRWAPVAWITAIGFALSVVGAGLIILLIMALVSAASLIMRWRRASGDERDQLKWIGSAAAAFVFLLVLDAVLGLVSPAWNDAWIFYLATLAIALIPTAAGIAILRYHLYDIDLIINRTLVYVPLSAILAGIFAASITLSQKLFVAATGAASDAATVLTTLIVVAAFEPLKKWLQDVVDRRYKTPRDPGTQLKPFADLLRARIFAIDPDMLARHLATETMKAFDADGARVKLGIPGGAPVIYAIGKPNEASGASIPLSQNGAQMGILELGSRRNGEGYTLRDRAALQELAMLVAQAIAPSP